MGKNLKKLQTKVMKDPVGSGILTVGTVDVLAAQPADGSQSVIDWINFSTDRGDPLGQTLRGTKTTLRKNGKRAALYGGAYGVWRFFTA